MRRMWTGLLLLVTMGCENVFIEKSPSPVGNAPPVVGIMEGSVLYIGTPPSCVREDDGTPTDIKGRVILTLFDYDNPPPPEGKATGAVDLLVIPGRELFNLEDCGPDALSLDPTAFISRTVPFQWPAIPLNRSYQIRGFYDRDADFIPFFSTRRGSTVGDFSGGALTSAGTFQQLSFGSQEDYPKGQVLKGILIELKAPVLTQPPMFEIDPGVRPISSTMPFANSTLPTFEQDTFDMVNLVLRTLDPVANAATLAAAGVPTDILTAPIVPQAWFTLPVDAQRDGGTEPHPIFEDFGYTWFTPMVFIVRARTPSELAAGIPDVKFIAATRQGGATPAPAPGGAHIGDIEMLVPPVAVVDLLPADRDCSIPYIAPSPFNIAQYYEDAEGDPKECQEFPTGYYSVSVLHGMLSAGAAGNAYSGQSWSIPNELGPVDSKYFPTNLQQLDDSVLLPSQGPASRMIVVDSDPSSPITCSEALDPSPPTPGTPGNRQINFNAVPTKCCGPVAHLCGIPLCEAQQVGVDQWVREFTGEVGEDGIPSCVPFLPPATCCQ